MSVAVRWRNLALWCLATACFTSLISGYLLIALCPPRHTGFLSVLWITLSLSIFRLLHLQLSIFRPHFCFFHLSFIVGIYSKSFKAQLPALLKHAFRISPPRLGGLIWKIPEERNGNPLQYSCLGNPMDRGAWQATVYGVAKESHNSSKCS